MKSSQNTIKKPLNNSFKMPQKSSSTTSVLPPSKPVKSSPSPSSSLPSSQSKNPSNFSKNQNGNNLAKSSNNKNLKNNGSSKHGKMIDDHDEDEDENVDDDEDNEDEDEEDEEEEEEDDDNDGDHSESKSNNNNNSKSKVSSKNSSSSSSTPSSSTALSISPPPSSSSSSPPSFSSLGVSPSLLPSLHRLGWLFPTPIQREVLPFSFSGNDIIGLAETGSGKTGAFVLPIIQALLSNPQSMFALILTPTRELSIQISEQIEAIGGEVGVTTAILVGGVDFIDQSIQLARRPHVIIGTPGRVVDHLSNTKGFQLDNIKFLVLDEADRLLAMEFEKEIDTIIDIIPKKRQTLLFSATMTSKVAKLQRASLVNPIKVEVSKKYQTSSSLTQQYSFLPAKHKELYLVKFLSDFNGSLTIIFCATCESAHRLSLILRQCGYGAVPLHGKMTQPKRLGSLNKFKSNERNILVCTDVASRGLDIPNVDLVINYDVPNHSKDYIHRVGRTARAGKTGRSITMVTQYDVELIQRIETLLGYKLDEYKTEQTEMMRMADKVAEAAKMAAQIMRESEMMEKEKGKGKGEGMGKGNGKRTKRGRGGEDDDDENGNNGHSRGSVSFDSRDADDDNVNRKSSFMKKKFKNKN